MSRGIGIIDPTIGASEYGANIAQWDWKPFSDAMSAAKTTYGMVRQNQEENLEQSITRALFPSAKKKAELDLKMLEADIKKTDAMTDYYLGRNDADSLGTSGYAGDLFRARYGDGFAKSLSFISGIGGANTSAGLSGKTPTSGISGTGFNSY
jgi:hypothetical protein